MAHKYDGSEDEERRYQAMLERVASNIKCIRKKKGITQEDMRHFGMNYRYFQKIESGKYSLSLRTLHKVADLFGQEIGDLISNHTE